LFLTPIHRPPTSTLFPYTTLFRSRERAATEESPLILGDKKVAHVLEQEIARALEHPVVTRVLVDERPHVVDILDARRPDRDAHASACRASSSASRTRPGAVPPGELRDATERSALSSSIALVSKRSSKRRRSAIVMPLRSWPLARRSRTMRPTISWASRNGTPRFARWSARSVAPSIPRSVARRIASRSKRTPPTTSASVATAG